jgi:hypothetical protein
LTGKIYKKGMRLAVMLPDGRVCEIPEVKHISICSSDGNGHWVVPSVTPMTGYRVIVL